MEVFWWNLPQQKRIGNNMPIVEISCPPLPQDAKDRIAKKITEIIAEEEKKAFKIDTTSITLVGFRDMPVPNIYIGTKPLAKVLETLPKG
jgi:phenylpyruvate tautomerase PptA (4-oxalocrotonate tautomerase family)